VTVGLRPLPQLYKAFATPVADSKQIKGELCGSAEDHTHDRAKLTLPADNR
jgi:hypothetical protein